MATDHPITTIRSLTRHSGFRSAAVLLVLSGLCGSFVIGGEAAVAAKPTRWTVNQLTDQGLSTCAPHAGFKGAACELRDAIAKAAAGDIIDLTNVNGTMMLTNGALQVTQNLVIDGAGAARLVIDGNQRSNVLVIADKAIVSIADLTIMHGENTGANNDYGGGGILNKGDLTLKNAWIMDNVTRGPVSGGGIFNQGSLLIDHCIVAGNASAEANGGGIENYNGGTVTIIDSTIANNTATSEAATGGGVHNFGQLAIDGSTISGNSSQVGAGIDSEGLSLTIKSSTIADNNGDGVFNTPSGDPASIIDSTIAGNTVNGLVGNMVLFDDIVAQNGSSNSPDAGDLAGLYMDQSPFISLGYNLIGDGTFVSGNPAPRSQIIPATGDQIGNLTTIGVIDPLLGTLTDNGGPTKTMAITDRSPAYRKGGCNGSAVSVPVIGAIQTDQRGNHRKGRCDIGAFEAASSSAIAINLTSVLGSTGHTITLNASVDGATIVTQGTVTVALYSDIATTKQIGPSIEGAVQNGFAHVQLPRPALVGRYYVTAAYHDAAGQFADSHPASGIIENKAAANTTLIVTTLADMDSNPNCFDGVCTLRTAIAYASAGDTIRFQPGLHGTLTLGDSGALNVDADVAIEGPSATQLAIIGYTETPVFNVLPNVTASLSDLTIQHVPAADPLFNESGNGISNSGTLTINRCAIMNNGSDNGGGIYNEGTLVVNASTIAHNDGHDAGGINNESQLTLINSTVADNTDTGIANDGSLTVISSTISGNTGSGILNNDQLVLRSDIVANNTNQGIPDDVYNNNYRDGRVRSLGYNLIGNGTGSDLVPATHDQIGTVTTDHPIDPQLGALADNGGNTQTMAITRESPAYQVGFCGGLNIDQFVIAALTTDQRGTDRKSHCDVGAYEVPGSAQTVVINVIPTEGIAGQSAVLTATVTGSTSVTEGTVRFSLYTNAAMTQKLGDPITGSVQDEAARATLLMPQAMGRYFVAATYHDSANRFPDSSAATPGLLDDNAPPNQILTVNSLADVPAHQNCYSGSCGLRTSIEYASAGDTIVFKAGLAGVLMLEHGNLTIGTNLTIQGPGAATLAIDGNRKSNIFSINKGATVSISGLTIQHGAAFKLEPAGLENDGTLTLDQADIAGNLQIGVGCGGMDNRGIAVIKNSTFTSNVGGDGGGICNENILTVSNSTFYQNTADRGGGIFTYVGSETTVANSTIDGNSDTDNGGGIDSFGALNLLSTIVAGNKATQLGDDVYGGDEFVGEGITSLGHNLIGDGSASNVHWEMTDQVGNITTGNVIDPLLEVPGNNGEATPTMAITSRSPAYGKGYCGGNTLVMPTAPAVTADQRGQARKGKSTGCDAGAYEAP